VADITTIKGWRAKYSLQRLLQCPTSKKKT
jgi:hypothetical protein